MKEKILATIITYIQSHGYGPSIREIGEAVGLASSSSVHHYLTDMYRDGMIETDASGSARAIRVPGYRFVKDDE